VSNSGAVISISQGAVVVSHGYVNAAGAATLRNSGELNLSGSFDNRTSATAAGNGTYRIGGDWTNNGDFQYGQSTVVFNGAGTQQVLSAQATATFHNLSVENSGAASGSYVQLGSSVQVMQTLSMASGNRMASGGILHLVNAAASSLSYTSTTSSRIFGQFERGAGEAGAYLFPLGNIARASYYNPATIEINAPPAQGSILGEFVASAPGNAGLPLADNSASPGVEIDSAYAAGYWRMTARNSFSSANYSIRLRADGFNDDTYTVTANTRIITRTPGGNWTLDGVHADLQAINTARRNSLTGNISAAGTEYGLGQANPLITGNPAASVVCEETGAVFTVEASGTAVTYQWYHNGAAISGATSATLAVTAAELSDAGTYYCLVRDSFRRVTASATAQLSVMKIPVATATPTVSNADACTGVPFNPIALGLTYADPNTQFRWSWTAGEASAITTGDVPTLGAGNSISGTFANTANAPVTVTFRIVPVGPTQCEGSEVTSAVTVNPRPQIVPVNAEICYGEAPEIKLETATTFTRPVADVLSFGYTAYTTHAGVGGYTRKQSGIAYGSEITSVNGYTNTTNTMQTLTYRVAPMFTSALAGCFAGDSVSFQTKIHANPLQEVKITKELTCDANHDASLQAITSTGAGGAQGYYFEWDRNSTDKVAGYGISELTNRSSGVWTVTVTDGMNCKNTLNTYVSGTNTFNSYLYNNPNANSYSVTCPGGTDGTITISELTGSMATAPFEYWITAVGLDTASTGKHGHLMNKGDTAMWRNLPAGIYHLYIRDAKGCYNPRSLSTVNPLTTTITEPARISTYIETTHVSCSGGSDGTIEIKAVSGGNGGYTYEWKDGSGTVVGTTGKLENMPAGKYYLQVTDRKHCFRNETVTVTEPAPLKLDSYDVSLKADGVHNISCHGGTDGYIGISVSGGTGDYKYEWTGPGGFTSVRENISRLKAGVYSCTVSDGNNCRLTLPPFTLTEPQELNISAVLPVSAGGAYSIGCPGGTGAVAVSVAGGATGAYSYTWSTANGAGIVAGQKNQPALAAGTYSLTVTDMNGCEKTVEILLTQPDELKLQVAVKHITCLSSVLDDGAVNLTVSGGEAPYTFAWSNGAATEDIAGLTWGEYTVTVTDLNGCTATVSATVIDPPPLTYASQLSSYNGFNTSCYGTADGYINIEITGGTPQYVFTWTGPDGFAASTQNISGLKAGEYTLNITDSLACVASGVFSITEPGKLGMDITVSSSIDGHYSVNCPGNRSGTIAIEPLNNVGNVAYLWSDGLYGQTRSGLPAGNYGIIITDANGCYANSSVALTEPEPVTISFVVEQPFCNDIYDGSVTAHVQGGGGGYTYLWPDGSTGSSLADINPGWYSVVVTDINGCTVTDSVKVEPLHGSCLVIPNAISPNGDLINDEWNIGNIHIYPAAEVKIFNRWGYSVWTSGRGYPRPWDGTGGGRALPVDSYHYIIDLHNGNKPVTGTITIVK
jgi:gliding motility-associated-like protein